MPKAVVIEQPVVVVGGGWAGLSAAVTLCAQRVPVLLLESARQLGGRARSVRLENTILDNGQHLMVGAYQSMLELMQQIGVRPDDVMQRLPLALQLYRKDKISLRLKAARLPAPLNLLIALLSARGLSFGERLKVLRFVHRLARLSDILATDISVQALLHSEAQSPEAIRKLWDPLCVATLNTPASVASARLFVTVLRTTFLHAARDSDLLIPRRELNELLPSPCADYLEQNGARIELGRRVTSLDIDARSIRGVGTDTRQVATCHVILATPHIITRRLLSGHPPLEPLTTQMGGLGHAPISTLYFQYPTDTRLPLPMVGFDGALAQWVFDRASYGQPGLMAVVISARGEHAELPADILIERVAGELAGAFPHWPPATHSHLLREKRATFCARVNIDAHRPANATKVEGLWLAGDYTNTGQPATLEGAVRRGQDCARQVLGTLLD